MNEENKNSKNKDKRNASVWLSEKDGGFNIAYLRIFWFSSCPFVCFHFSTYF